MMNLHSHCDNCFNLNCDHVSCKLIDCQQSGCEYRMHECKLNDHLDSICSRVRVPCINSGFGCNLVLLRKDIRSHLEKCPASIVSCAYLKNNRSRSNCYYNLPAQSKFKDHFKQIELIRDDSTLTSNLEAIAGHGEPSQFNTKHQLKPQVCDSDFRRSEYCSHYQNVHCDIVASLNGWMEIFCPNQQYGCPFSTRRIQPIFNDRKTKIVFSKQNKAFGLLVSETESHNNPNKGISLTDLPVELISHILSFLDGFSLNNISLTNKWLRSVCCNLLESRGMVSLIWKKETDGWTIAAHRWKFSNNFSMIEKWKFENAKFLNHFANECKHFDKLVNEEPFRLIGLGVKKTLNVDVNSSSVT